MLSNTALFLFTLKGGEEREEKRKEEAEGGGLIFMQAHALVAPLGPSIMGGFCVPAS